MKKFMDDNFLLNNEVAMELYHKFAKEMPIYDYHCHLSPQEISSNKQYQNITELWLSGDHYKWRAMRSNGIEEKYITGEANDYEKFMAWAKTISMCIGNPLFHWTHLELQRYFGIYDVLNEATAEDIWKRCNELLKRDDFRAKGLIEKSNVKVICTTDDPVDSLEYHKKIKEDKEFQTKVLPTFRPDRGLNIERDIFDSWLQELSEVCQMRIETYTEYLKALDNRIEYFHEVGCRISDHSLEEVSYFEAKLEEVEKIFSKRLNKGNLSRDEVKKFKTYTLNYLGKKYNEYSWVMQLHMGALRNNNTRMFALLGGDAGFDSINDQCIAEPLSRILDALDTENQLPKTILYCLNPKDNYVIGTMLGNFQGGNVGGKVQFGSGWWFNDQKDGMINQMTSLASLGLLGRFVGMLTDSRSFISYTRHEYFRRSLCNLIGQWVVDGEVPYSLDPLEDMVKNICYNNAVNYFDIEL
ncbi:glucuronate isomerase [Alkaliphilus peptidifermentans]|uniref:Uronate isomerase n=1 Tax=Alkaliphilus peptidifermentans DSM 18978 TaxID=1120976 RepID=A0A1G5CBY8_9FIRM|nr:glucuronate isomerase [Alkaliphilus peptidifermentans]SCX99851.1 D-glucuronate isomerase [Alkaliphilus peptidifermentans DSM 18978]